MLPFLRWLLWALAFVAGASWLALAGLRLNYPFELEWLEGGMLAQVQELLAGRPVYGPPSLEYAAFPYPPAFTWCAALLSYGFGPSFLALRLVSCLATLVVLALLYEHALRRGGGRSAGLVAVGLFCASYRYCGAWFDLARVDMLALAAVLAGWRALHCRRRALALALASSMFALACLSKQSSLMPVLALLLVQLRLDLRRGLMLALPTCTLLGLSVFWLDWRSDGWFRWTVWSLLRGHEWSRAQAFDFGRSVLQNWWPLILLLLFSRLRRAATPDATECTLALALVLASWIQYTHTGSYDNALLGVPLAGVLCLIPCIGSLRLQPKAISVAAYMLAIVQFGLLAYDPRSLLPTAADRAAGEALVAELAVTPGPIFMPYHDYLARRAGKGPSIHAMAIIDLLRSRERDVAARFAAELETALVQRRYAGVVLDDPLWEETQPALLPNYQRAKQFFAPGDKRFLPVCGAPWRPLLLYRARP